MPATLDLPSFFRAAQSVAAQVPAEALFSLLRRSFTVPAGFMALVHRRGGGKRVVAATEQILDDDFAGAYFVRSAPLDLSFDLPQLRAVDGYACTATARLTVRVLADAAEVEAFLGRVLGSKPIAEAAAVSAYLQDAVVASLRAIAEKNDSSAMVDGKCTDEFAAAMSDALQPLLFAGGLSLDGRPAVEFASTGLAHARRLEEQSAHRLREEQGRTQVQQALRAAQQQRLTEVETVLARLKDLAAEQAGTTTPELLKAFNESQRGQLYHALLSSRARQRQTQWIIAVAGSELLYFDPKSPAEPVRRLRIEGPLGGLRSANFSRDKHGHEFLLVGAAKGVYFIADDGEPAAFEFGATGDVRGGVNAAAMRDAHIVGTHSEQRAVMYWWMLDGASKPYKLLEAITSHANVVRHATFAQEQFWCTIDDMIVRVPAAVFDHPDASAIGDIQPIDAAACVVRPDLGVITALHVGPEGLFIGTAEGHVARLADPDHAPEMLHSGGRRPAESVAVQTISGVPMLFYTDTSLAVHCRVLGDSFACRYEAGGQTIRRAEFAGDVVAATTEVRDRIILWTIDDPARPSAVIPIARITGHSVQDICLSPCPPITQTVA